MIDRPVLLTGAGGGVGVALADELLSRGARKLAFQYRSESPELFEVVLGHGLDPASHCFRADLRSESDVRSLGAAVGEAFGELWGLVNLAGSTSNAMSWKLSLEEFDRVLGDSVVTTFLACREFIPVMREARGGRIVNISSVVAFSGIAGASHYGAAKAGVVGFTKSIARELVGRNVTANALALGYFDYGMLYTVPEELREGVRKQIPAGRFGEAVELAGALAYLLSEEAAYTTGQVLHVNGGLYG